MAAAATEIAAAATPALLPAAAVPAVKDDEDEEDIAVPLTARGGKPTHRHRQMTRNTNMFRNC